MTTQSTNAILNTIRSRLLTFAPLGGGPTLATQIGSTASGSGSDGKLFKHQAPDDLTGTWGVLRLRDFPQQGFDGGMMLRGQVELILYGKPRTPTLVTNLERMADTVTEAWMDWAYTASGHISAHDITSRFHIPYEEPANRELVAIRLLLPFRCAPTFLTQYASA